MTATAGPGNPDLRAVALPDVAAVVLLCPSGAGTGDGPLPAVLRAAVERLGLRAPRLVRREPSGRPYLAHPDGRRWDVDFNISHSGGLVGVAVGVGGRLGLDVQEAPGPGWERIARRWLHPRERRRIDALPPAEGCREFTRVWAVREARCKATGRGLAGFRSPGAVADAACGHLDGVTWRELPVPDGYAAALAFAGGHGRDWLACPVVIAPAAPGMPLQEVRCTR
ncbi:4'-phosphopantetheinyl transferase superfamily protein [Actinomadura sp. NPDC047616]|uniref:4'-phosphopantetheinyl transferase family protein n=1 Tax=Actinomadura sp. NPDC047616 TaxID=3155914 RepID=UPI0033F09305